MAWKDLLEPYLKHISEGRKAFVTKLLGLCHFSHWFQEQVHDLIMLLNIKRIVAFMKPYNVLP